MNIGKMLPIVGSGVNRLPFLLISVFLLITTFMIIGIYIFIFNSVELRNKNMLKTPFSYMKIIDFLGIFLMVLLSYSDSPLSIILITIGYTVYLLIHYVRNFPFPSREMSLFYINSMSIFVINMSLYIFYTQTQKTNQTNFLYVSIIFSTILCAINQTLWVYFIQLINRYNIIFNRNKDIRKQLLFFTTILELIKLSAKEENAYVKLQGLMNQHQIECKDANCPCLSKFIVQKYKTEEQKQQELLLEQQALTSIALQEDQRLIKTKTKGIYLFELSQNRQSYFQWILEFIDYHFSLCIKNQKQDHYLEEFCIKFWYFQCKDKNNSIKCLYLVKHHTQLFQEKSIFFRIVQMAMTQFIENKIKEKDKSLRYSYRQTLFFHFKNNKSQYKNQLISESIF